MIVQNGATPRMPFDWTVAVAPSLATFEALAEAAWAGLPARITALCAGVVLRIDDFPDEETLDVLAADSEFDLLGLFRGQGLAQGQELGQTGQMPNMIWLYRRPILDYWAAHEERLGDIIRHVLVHEIGHHFGLSDADMEAIEREV